MSVELVEITAETVRDVCRLDAGDGGVQVAPNAVSIAQAYFHRAAWFRAIHADGTLVGFVMLWDPSLDEQAAERRHFVWRFMIDARFQGRGHGRAALLRAIGHVATRPGADALYLSHVKGVERAARFYRSLGFEYTGEEDGGELIMKRVLGG